MKIIAQVVSWLSLVLGIVLTPALFYFDKLSHDRMKLIMLVATILWFAATPLWMGRKPNEQAAGG